MQKIILTGNVCNDPEMKSTPSGATVCSFVVAVDRKFKDAHGEKVTDFFRVQAWRQLGDVCGKYVKKGMKVGVIGELQARTYEAKDGTTRMSLDVNAEVNSNISWTICEVCLFCRSVTNGRSSA